MPGDGIDLDEGHRILLGQRKSALVVAQHVNADLRTEVEAAQPFEHALDVVGIAEVVFHHQPVDAFAGHDAGLFLGLGEFRGGAFAGEVQHAENGFHGGEGLGKTVHVGSPASRHPQAGAVSRPQRVANFIWTAGE